MKSVVEAYRLGRYDNCYFPVSTPGAQQFEETMDGNDKAPQSRHATGGLIFSLDVIYIFILM